MQTLNKERKKSEIFQSLGVGSNVSMGYNAVIYGLVKYYVKCSRLMVSTFICFKCSNCTQDAYVVKIKPIIVNLLADILSHTGCPKVMKISQTHIGWKVLGNC